MTQKANPSISRPAEAFKTAGAIAYGGHGESGFIIDGANPTDISTQDSGIDEAALNTFTETSSGTSFDVTIDPGEAFVFGAWIAIDTETTITLASDTTGQTVYVGWNKNGSDDVIVGLASAFSTATGDTDEKIPLYDFDTDADGVTAVSDRRSFDQIKVDTIEQGPGSELNADLLDGNEASDLGVDVSNSGTTVTTATSDLNFNSDLTAVDDSDGTSTISVTNNTVTVAGNSVSLGGSTTVNHNDLSTISTDDHHIKYTDENAQDAVGGILNTDFTYDDAGNSISLSSNSVTVSSGTDLTGGGTVSLGGSITINHADTSTQGNVSTGGSTIIDDIELDGSGHVSNINTQNRDLNDWVVPTDFNINSSARFGLPHRTSDPAAAAGDIWYRTDLD